MRPNARKKDSVVFCAFSGILICHRGHRKALKEALKKVKVVLNIIRPHVLFPEIALRTKINTMLQQIHPKLPMRNKALTKAYYIEQLGFKEAADYGDYLIIQKDAIEIHFFSFPELDQLTNYGQVYIRTNDIDNYYQSLKDGGVAIHPNGPLSEKPWGQKEFSLLDPDHNLLTFGWGINRAEIFFATEVHRVSQSKELPSV